MRLLEIITTAKSKEEFKAEMDREGVIDYWTYASEDKLVIKVLTTDDSAKAVAESLEEHPHDRLVIYPIEGTRPKIDTKTQGKRRITFGKFFSVSKEELYEDIKQPVNLSMNFILMLTLSSFVAGIGILKNSEPIIIGAMVIAPFLGPNMAMSFGTTIGDWSVIKKSVLAGLLATAVAVTISTLWGVLSPDVENIARDTALGYQDIALALICGFAGVIAMISGRGATMVGVMVAVALLPPIMRSGLLLGGGYYYDSLNSFLIFSTNIVCINIAGIVTFNLAGIRPRKWYEKKSAQKKVRTAIILWLAALAILVIFMLLLEKYNLTTIPLGS